MYKLTTRLEINKDAEMYMHLTMNVFENGSWKRFRGSWKRHRKSRRH
jgi:hypothetical protein